MQPKIIFLTLNVANKLRVVCDVVDQEFTSDKKIVVHISDENEAKSLDNMLWSWKQSSFIPHRIISEEANGESEEPVLIATNSSDLPASDILILGDPVDQHDFEKYETIIDFAEKYNPTKLESDRKRYKLYRDEKFPIETLNPGEYLHK